MRKLATLLLVALLLPPVWSLAEGTAVSSNDLIENARSLDGGVVCYTGEVIGDILKRGDHTWLNISDGNNAMGVWVETALLDEITTPGRYGEHGDEVRVTGVFHRACAEHGGDMDLHATQIELLYAGYPTAHRVQPWQLIAALVFTAADAVAAVGLLRKRRGGRADFHVHTQG